MSHDVIMLLSKQTVEYLFLFSLVQKAQAKTEWHFLWIAV